MNQVTVIGDVNVDIVSLLREPLQLNSDTQTTNSLNLGGSPCNMAMWLAHLGTKVNFIAAIGDDLLGEWISAKMAAGNLPVDQLQIVPDSSSGTCLILVNSDGHRTMLPDPGANLSLELTSAQLDLIKKSSVVVMSAYTFLRPETRPIAQQVLELVEKSSARLVLDAASAAPISNVGVDLVRKYLNQADIVLANEDEFALLSDSNWAQSVNNLVVKLGASGAKWIINGELSCVVPANPVKVVDTTGAGDSFLAGLVSVLTDHEDWFAIGNEEKELALRRAVETAEQNITNVGAGPRS